MTALESVVTHRRLPRLRRLKGDHWRQRRRRQAIDSICRGYSAEGHWAFFREILERPEIRRVLILGVYYGRDIAYMSESLFQLGRQDVTIVGVDKFEDTSCPDWPESQRHLSWAKAGFGVAPDLEAARRNLDSLGFSGRVTLVKGLAENYLSATSGEFDLIYIDTSHDYETTRRTIELSLERVSRGGFIAGDDFSDEGTWGVASAVRDCFTRFELFGGWIWLASEKDRRIGAPWPAPR